MLLPALFHLLNNIFKVITYFSAHFFSQHHVTISVLLYYQVEFSTIRIFLRIIFTEMRTPAFFSFQRGHGYRLRYRDHIPEIKSRMPSRVEFAVARNPYLVCTHM